MALAIVGFKSDQLGVLASSLCLVHCLATPLLFVAKTCSMSCCAEAPLWWGLIDVAFLAVSLFAVYWSAASSTNLSVKAGLWTSWVMLALIIANEQFGLISMSKYSIYIPAVALISLHIINLRYCRCANDECCSSAIVSN